jgi:hypothetical protein
MRPLLYIHHPQYGEAVVSQTGKGDIGFLKRGDYFGETALLKHAQV